MHEIAAKLYHAHEDLVTHFKACGPSLPSSDFLELYPSDYCKTWLQEYLRLAAQRGTILIVGMNAGPDGMGQTGIAFTDQPRMRAIFGARSWSEHPAETRPLPERTLRENAKNPPKRGRFRFHGGMSNLQEDSASRLWPFLYELLNPCATDDPCTPEHARAIVDRFLFVNACPALWLTNRGTNVSAADKRVVLDTRAMYAMGTWLKSLRDLLQPSAIIAAGDWAATRCKHALGTDNFTKMRHPSPIAGTEATWREKAGPVLMQAIKQQNKMREE